MGRQRCNSVILNSCSVPYRFLSPLCLCLAAQALGCVVIEMASGRDPWSEKNFQGAFQAIFHIGGSGEIPMLPATLSEEGKDFCRQCLIRNPDQRPSAKELLNHAFVRDKSAALPPGRPPTPSAYE